MTTADYLDKHNNQYPFGTEHETESKMVGFMLCDTEEEIEYDLKSMIAYHGKEKFELFKEYCIACNELPHIFSPDGDGIADKLGY